MLLHEHSTNTLGYGFFICTAAETVLLYYTFGMKNLCWEPKPEASYLQNIEELPDVGPRSSVEELGGKLSVLACMFREPLLS